jgi:hypothetical protein
MGFGCRVHEHVQCDGFRMPGARTRPRALRRVAGVRKPPKNEGAGVGHPVCRKAMGILEAGRGQGRRIASGSGVARERRGVGNVP